MRVAYLDCFAGISGDMFLGALVDAGVPEDVLSGAVAALELGASLRFERVDRSGIMATKVHVMEGDRLAEEAGHSHSHQHEDGHVHPHSHAAEAGGFAQQERSPEPVATHSYHPKTQHLHKTGHAHAHPHTHDGEHGHGHAHGEDEHSHEHAHGRSLTVIKELIGRAALAEPVKRTAIRAFELLGESEAKIHGVPVEQIHFHEVGAVDAIVDIVAASAGVHHLEIGAWYSSPLNVGGGMVQCAHGLFPVPAPATADLLRGVPTYSAHVEKELVTPTGAALVRALAPEFGAQPAMVVDRIGYGAGTRNPKDFPNVLRLVLGDTGAAREANASTERQTVAVLETALDDLSPQVTAYVAEQALAAGALDVMLTPVVMKKGRAGTLVTLLCAPADAAKFEAMLLRETSTLGVRTRMEQRACLERELVQVQTAYGEVRVKVGRLVGGEELNATPEFEDCRRAAATHAVPLKAVQAAAVAAYRELTAGGAA